MYAQILIQAVCVLITLASSDYQSNITATYRELCPFSETCTQPPKLQFKSELDKVPCCRQCSCEDDCWKAGACCPDSEYATKSMTDTDITPRRECLTSIFTYSKRIKQKATLIGYPTITTCPENYSNESVVSSCKRSDPTTLEEVVFVSDAAGNIYRNAYCAVCNGVSIFKRWDMHVTCDSTDTLGSDINMNVLKDSGCIIWSDNDISEERKCYISEYSKCNMTGQWTSYDAIVKQACESGQYGAYQVLFSSFYWNVFCYMCNTNGPTNDICLPYSVGMQLTSLSFTAIFNDNAVERIGDRQPGHGGCSDNEIYDKYADICRELKCPVLSYPSNGECKPKFRVTDGYPMKVCMRTDVMMGSSATVRANSGDFREVKNDIQNVFEERRGDCLVCPVRMRADPSVNSSTLSACVILLTTTSCPLSDLLSLIQRFDNSTIYTNTTVYNTQLLSEELPSLDNGMFFMNPIVGCNSKKAIYFTEIKCPHIHISGYDYVQALRKNAIPLTKHFYTYNLGQLNETTLSMISFDICLDEYFTDSRDDVISSVQQIVAPLRLIICCISIWYVLGF